jgi:hypothetical protein
MIGIGPMSQSRKHTVEPLEGEAHDAFDKRTWKEKAHYVDVDGVRYVSIPAHGLQQCLTAGAKHTGKKVPGRGSKQWGGIIEKGVAVPYDVVTSVREKDVKPFDGFMNADGRRGSGTRVMRRFPMMYDWSAEATFWVIDPTITEAIFLEMLSAAGLFIGLGRFRPANGGSNGRFTPEILSWSEMGSEELAA